jgi:hypothetical protein
MQCMASLMFLMLAASIVSFVAAYGGTTEDIAHSIVSFSCVFLLLYYASTTTRSSSSTSEAQGRSAAATWLLSSVLTIIMCLRLERIVSPSHSIIVWGCGLFIVLSGFVVLVLAASCDDELSSYIP